MPTSHSKAAPSKTTRARTGDQPTEATMKGFVAALSDIAAAVADNTQELQAAQRAASIGGSWNQHDHGERHPSVEQLRTTLDYQVLGGLVGRLVAVDLTVQAQRFDDEGDDRVTFFDVPASVVKVSVHADGDAAPELLGFDSYQGSDKTITLVATAGKDIARTELQNSAGQPVRLGPRLARLPDGTVFA